MAVDKRPRLLIEEWLPAAAIGVECIRERSTGQQPPDKRLHVWWARRPLCVSRAAVLGSLLPADFPRDVFERLLGFGRPEFDWGKLQERLLRPDLEALKEAIQKDRRSRALVLIRSLMDQEFRIDGGFGCGRAFKAPLSPRDLEKAHAAVQKLWGKDVVVIDPMAGGGSIPLESARLGFKTLANEYNPVACSVLEATVDYPFRFGAELVSKARKWVKVWLERIEKRLAPFYPEHRFSLVYAYVFARTVPCPDTGFGTPLVPDWHLLKPKSGVRICAVPTVDKAKGTWKVTIREIGSRAGRLKDPPRPTYSDGKGISIFTGRQIPAEYIKSMAQQGKMLSQLYALAVKSTQGLEFVPPDERDLLALELAAESLGSRLPTWKRKNIIPTEQYPEVSTDERPRIYGMPGWADMFSPRQLLGLGTAVELLLELRSEMRQAESEETAEALTHLLAFAVDKFANYNALLASWNPRWRAMRSVFDRHDFSFKSAFAELAACSAGNGFKWAVEDVLDAYEELGGLSRADTAVAVDVTLGSATNLPGLRDEKVAAVIVDPPYADNVQYSELADFFYVWLKRTQGHRRPEWFSTYLCEHDQEAVVNAARHRDDDEPLKVAKARAHEFYQKLMADVFRECHRVLRDDGVLTVMFTHKKQEAWEALFESLIQAGFMIEATWPVKTESEHSLHQAKKNAAQSTVILVSRKRPAEAGVGYFDMQMRDEIRRVARSSAERLRSEGLNAVDQLVGSFGPAMKVYSRYDEVRTDTGDPVGVAKAIDEASDAVSRWRIEQLAARGLEGVEAEGQFYLLCWDVLGAAEFRYNEAHLLGKAVGVDVDQLIAAGLVSKSGEKIKILSAKDRRRERALEPNEVEDLLFGTVVKQKKRTKKDIRKIHPNDPQFLTALDACHATALRYIEAKGGTGGIGSAKALMRQQGWGPDSAVAKLMEALVKAAPEAVKFEKGKKSVAATFPEFRAWYEMLKPLFGIEPPEWKEKQIPQGMLAFPEEEAEDDQDEGLEDKETGEGENDGLSEE